MQRILNGIRGLIHESSLRSEFESAPKEWLLDFVATVDESPYDLLEWLRAHDILITRSAQSNRYLNLQKRQEYLCCCVEGMRDTGGSLTLTAILEYYLDRNGIA